MSTIRNLWLTLAVHAAFGCSALIAQDAPYPMVNGTIRYEGIDSVPGAQATELQRRGKHWLAETYHSAMDGVAGDSAAAQSVFGTFAFDEYWKANFANTVPVRFSGVLTIRCKDGRYKYTVTNMRVHYALGYAEDRELETWNNDYYSKNGRRIHSQVHADVLQMIEAMKASMRQPVKDDW